MGYNKVRFVAYNSIAMLIMVATVMDPRSIGQILTNTGIASALVLLSVMIRRHEENIDGRR